MFVKHGVWLLYFDVLLRCVRDFGKLVLGGERGWGRRDDGIQETVDAQNERRS